MKDFFEMKMSNEKMKKRKNLREILLSYENDLFLFLVSNSILFIQQPIQLEIVSVRNELVSHKLAIRF